MYAQSLSHVQLFATPWTVARQAPLSTGFPRQEYWSGLPFPSPGDLPGWQVASPKVRTIAEGPQVTLGGQRDRLFLTAPGTCPTPPAELPPPVAAHPQLQAPCRRLLSLWSRVRWQLPDGGLAQLGHCQAVGLSPPPVPPETWPSTPRAQIRPGSTLTPRAAGENATNTPGGGG